MFLDFLIKLKESKLPVSLGEFLTFLDSLQFNIVEFDINKFYYLARTSLIKDEKLIDKFDIVFGEYFKAIEKIELDDVLNSLSIPKDWLEKVLSKHFTKKEMESIKSQGGIDKLIEKFKKRLEEQKKRHQGGNKWIGTSGTSPFGAYGYNPEGIRIGQDSRINGKAIKVWDKRIFKDFDSSNELDTRGFQIALKRLRQWAKTGLNEELDLDETINNTSKNGYLDITTKKERENSIKIVLFFDVGGSMDYHVQKVEQLFAASRNVFKNLNYFYFHNCLYEDVWKKNDRRWEERISTHDIFRTFNKDYKCIFVGDASMSPYEILVPGAGNEHYNHESGKIWLERAIKNWPSNVWINPLPKNYWDMSHSNGIIKEIFSNKMVSLNLKGLEEAMKLLS